MKGASVEVEFKGNTKDVEKKAKGLSSNLKGLVSTGSKALLSLGVASATALITITTKAIKAQGELEQQIGGTEAVFGKLAKTIQNDSTKAFETMGLSANDYMQYINKMGALMKGSGISTKKAMDLSSKAMQRASDVASIMGISVDEAMRAIAGASKGNFTMMDNLGVAMNATSLNAYALEKGLKKTYKQMSQGEKVELAMQMFLEKSAYATGNYVKENKTLIGSLTTLKASIQNLITGTGSVDQVLNSLTNFGKIVLDKMIVLLPKVAETLIKLINGALPILTKNLPLIIQQLAPVLINGVTDLTLTLISVLPELITMISDIIPDLIPQLVDAIMILIPELIKNYPAFVKAGLKLTAGIVKGILLGVAQLIKSIVDLSKKVIDKLKEKFEGKSIWEIGKMLVVGLWNGINNVTDWVLEKIKGFGKSILNGIKKIFGISSPSKEFEIIGHYNILGLEEGMKKESVEMQKSFNDMFSLNPNMYGTASTHLSPNIEVINNINMKQDPLGQMVRDIKTFSGGAKNDYSYRMGA